MRHGYPYSPAFAVPKIVIEVLMRAGLMATCLGVASCHRASAASELEVVEASAIRADWKALPIVASPGESVTVATHGSALGDPDTDERARFGPFALQWRETGYHSAPRAWVDPVVCVPTSCEVSRVRVWEGSGGIYRRVHALRHDAAKDVWYVSVTGDKMDESLGVAFARRHP